MTARSAAQVVGHFGFDIRAALCYQRYHIEANMNAAALTAASPLIQAHAYAAFAAIGLGAVQIALPKGTLPHRALGFGWAALMIVVAGSSMFIHTIRTFGPFSPIHLLSLFTLFVVPAAVYAAHGGRVATHAQAMRSIYVLALLVTGAFTLWPGRIMYKVVFDR
jgi:uncharacterized membrane protein